MLKYFNVRVSVENGGGRNENEQMDYFGNDDVISHELC